MFQCDFCSTKSPNEDLAISHVLHRHLDLIKTNRNWQECNLCLKFVPVWKEHQCWDSGICPLCSTRVCTEDKKRTMVFSFTTKQVENDDFLEDKVESLGHCYYSQII